jgi:sphingosine kinase
LILRPSETQRKSHAEDIVKETKDLLSYDGIVCVSGDGLLFEVLNGMLKRKDWKELIQKLTIGIIPAGSGNGVSTT